MVYSTIPTAGLYQGVFKMAKEAAMIQASFKTGAPPKPVASEALYLTITDETTGRTMTIKAPEKGFSIRIGNRVTMYGEADFSLQLSCVKSSGKPWKYHLMHFTNQMTGIQVCKGTVTKGMMKISQQTKTGLKQMRKMLERCVFAYDNIQRKGGIVPMSGGAHCTCGDHKFGSKMTCKDIYETFAEARANCYM